MQAREKFWGGWASPAGGVRATASEMRGTRGLCSTSSPAGQSFGGFSWFVGGSDTFLSGPWVGPWVGVFLEAYSYYLGILFGTLWFGGYTWTCGGLQMYISGSIGIMCVGSIRSHTSHNRTHHTNTQSTTQHTHARTAHTCAHTHAHACTHTHDMHAGWTTAGEL